MVHQQRNGYCAFFGGLDLSDYFAQAYLPAVLRVRRCRTGASGCCCQEFILDKTGADLRFGQYLQGFLRRKKAVPFSEKNPGSVSHWEEKCEFLTTEFGKTKNPSPRNMRNTRTKTRNSNRGASRCGVALGARSSWWASGASSGPTSRAKPVKPISLWSSWCN
jgi:hypothetical protein